VDGRALITGANGFIGSHLVELLQDRGDAPLAMVRKTSSTHHLDGRTVDYRHAGLMDVDAMAAAMDGVEVVYHLAGLTMGRAMSEYARVNGTGTANVMAAAKRAGVRRVVYVSSLAAAGPSHPEVPRAEHHTPTPLSVYGRSKHLGEVEAWRAAQDGTLEVVVARPPAVYGPRDTNFLKVIRMARRGLVVELGFKRAWFSAIHSHDLVRGIVLAGERGRPIPTDSPGHALGGGGLAREDASAAHESGDGVYFLTDGGRYTWAGMGKEAARLQGKRGFVVPLPVPLAFVVAAGAELVGKLTGRLPLVNRDKIREGSASGWWASEQRARDELGYVPEMPLTAGLEDTIRWAVDRGML